MGVISGHAPWSDTYESLLYISWSAVFAGVVFFRKSLLALSAAVIVAGIFMFRPHLDDTIKHITAINEIALIIGLTAITIGNFLGGVWANESWGRYWGWDPKETWAYVAIVCYIIVVHLRFV